MSTAATQAFTTLISSFVWLSLLHATWIGLVVAACVSWLFQARARISHRVRHHILVMSLGLVIAVPVVFAVIQATAIPSSYATTWPRRAVSLVVRAEGNWELHRDAPAVEASRENDSDSSPSSLSYMEAILVQGAALTQASQDYGLAMWCSACLVGFVTLAFSLKGMSRLMRDSVVADEWVIARSGQLAGALRLRRIPSVRVHPAVDQPCLCLIFRPAIILPDPWLSTAAPEMLDAVLAHELAHSKRLDPLWNSLQRLLDTAFFFHPGVRWLSRSLRHEREIAADSLAIKITGDPLALARALESVVRLCVDSRAPRYVGAAFGGQDPTLLPRIQELLGMTPSNPRFQLWPFAALSSAIVLALVTVSVGLARDEPAPGQQTQARSDESLVFSITTEEKSDRQISYEVRFIDTEPDVWREPLRGKLKPVVTERKIGRWIVDGKDSFDQLIKSVTARPTSRMTIAPKPTTFEAMPIVIRADTKSDGQIQPATKIRLSGTWLPAAIRMSIDLSDRLNASPRQEPGAPKDWVELRLEDWYDIPDGSSLLLSIDRHQRFIENRNVTCERLIVITPRRIDVGALQAQVPHFDSYKPAGDPVKR